jgi:hypothetical protein
MVFRGYEASGLPTVTREADLSGRRKRREMADGKGIIGKH